MNFWLREGAPPEKLIIGMGTYGRTFTLTSSTCAIGVAASGAGSAGPFTREAGMLGYNEVELLPTSKQCSATFPLISCETEVNVADLRRHGVESALGGAAAGAIRLQREPVCGF